MSNSVRIPVSVRLSSFIISLTAHHHHHLSRETSTARHRPPPKFSMTIGHVLPSSSDFPRSSPDRRSTLYAVAIRLFVFAICLTAY
jgi:hypothetical protein